MLPVGTKVVYDGSDSFVFGLEAGDEGFVVDNKPIIPDGSTIVVEFYHKEDDRMYTQEVSVTSVTSVDDDA